MNTDRQQLQQRIRTILANRTRQVLADPYMICAAVLIPLLQIEGEWHVLVTQRTETVGHHKGQISFPGGACESGDADYLDTALRETFEEIGVPPEAVEVLGAMDDFRTITDFVVTPVVGVIDHPFDYRLNEDEVQAVVEVPISFLCDPDNLRVEQMEYQGNTFDVLFWDYGDHTIWGATARALKTFLDLIF